MLTNDEADLRARGSFDNQGYSKQKCLACRVYGFRSQAAYHNVSNIEVHVTESNPEIKKRQ